MRLSVLVVDDSPASRAVLVAALEEFAGVAVITARGGFEALKLLPKHRFDLIITDIQMPDINGLELINFVKKNPNYRDTPLFVVTGPGREEDLNKGRALGASECLVKPFQPSHLAGLLRRYLNLP